MTESSGQGQKKTGGLSILQIIFVVFVFVCIVSMLKYIFTTLKFFYGVDYRMYCEWQAQYLKTGVFYPEKTNFYNFPLTVIAFGPYAFLPTKLAVVFKFIQTLTLGIFSLGLVYNIAGEKIIENRNAFFVYCVMAVAFITTQLYYLNIYVEVLTCLLLSLYFYKKKKLWLSALFLCLGILFKVFLAPLILAAFLSKDYSLFIKSCVCLIALILVSFLVFGFHTHLEMFNAMSATYTKMRMYGVSLPYVSDGFSGYQDFFNKLVVAGALTKKTVIPFTLISALFYGCVVLYILYIMFDITRRTSFDINNYIKIFASVLVLSLAFNFRFDHGLLLLVIVPFLALEDVRRTKIAVLSVIFIVLLRYVVISILNFIGFEFIAKYLSGFMYFFTFQFIGINLLVYFVVTYWLDLNREIS